MATRHDPHELKAAATQKFKDQRYDEAGELFSQAATSLLSTSPSDDPESLSLICACASNASQCYLKINNYRLAFFSATLAIDTYGDGSNLEFKVNKARFRAATALISMCESGSNDNSADNGEGSDSNDVMLDKAQKMLAMVLSEEPDNEQALELARRGLEVSRKVRDVDSINVDEKEGGGEGEDEEAMMLAAMGGGAASGGWGMQPNWLENNDNGDNDATAQTTDANFDDILKSVASKTKGMNVNDLVNSGLNEFKESSSEDTRAIGNSDSTKQAWSSLSTETQQEQQQFDAVLSNLSKKSALAGVKTTENNYSGGWRATHAQRRYKGKETKFEVSGGGATWEELNHAEQEAVSLVERTEITKKVLAEDLDGKLKNKVDIDGDDENATKEWRKTLNQRRRKGEEIKLTKKKSSTAFAGLSELEDGEIERVHKLNEQRKKAEKDALKKKKQLAKQRKIKKELGLE